jgi:hypothetical protein
MMRALWVWFSSCANSGTTSANAHQQSAHAARSPQLTQTFYISLSAAAEVSECALSLDYIYYFGRSDDHGESQTLSAAQNQTAGISMQIFIHEQRARTKFHAWLIAMEIRQLWKKYGFLLRGR